MWGINGYEALIIIVLAFLLIGPERLPKLVAQFKAVIGKAKSFAETAQADLSKEYGEDLDWEKLDPMQYHPKRIVSQVWNDGGTEDAKPIARTLPAIVEPKRDGFAPYDPEAT